MKIALLITGQPRTFELCKWFHKYFFIDDNCDIFLSVDKNNATQLLYKNNTKYLTEEKFQDIINFYNPVSYFTNNDNTEDDIQKYFGKHCSSVNYYKYDEQDNNKINEYIIANDTNNTIKFNNVIYNINTKLTSTYEASHLKLLYRQYYFLSKAYELLHNYIEKTNVHYDIIIRLRFDHIIWSQNFELTHIHKFDVVNNVVHDIAYTNKNIKLIQSIVENNDVNLVKSKINFDDIKTNCINVIGGGVYKNYSYVNDYFWTHGEDLIFKMQLFFLNFNTIINNTLLTGFPVYGAGIEHFFSVFLFENDIIINKTKMINNYSSVVRELP